MNYSETIFLTGFPGFIAEKLVERLAENDTRFYLLAQPQFVEKATRNIEEIASKMNLPLENFTVIKGDITLENLGISEKDLEIVCAQTTDVHHLAAVYDLAVKKDLAYCVNVEGTRNVNEFVKTLPNLRRYNYVSTCYVAGRRTGVVLETELEHEAGFRNYYEETKYLAEMEVEKLKAEIPTTIFRPSVVVGDSRTGETTKYDGIYYLMLYLRKAPNLLRFLNVGNQYVKLNLVPVDFVVRAIAALAKDDSAAGKTIALADPNPLTTEELFDAITETLINKKSVIKPPPKLIEWSLGLKIAPPLTGLPFPSVPYFFVPQAYDTSVSEKLLAPHEIACPNFKTYAAKLLKFVEENPKLKS